MQYTVLSSGKTRSGVIRAFGSVLAAALMLGMLVPLTATAATLPRLRIRDVTVNELDGAGQIARFEVRLSRTSSRAVTVNYTTVDGSATSTSDYTARSGQLRFRPGQILKRISVPITGDSLNEAVETFRMRLSNPTRARIADFSGLGTIIDNDGPPSLSVSNASANEGGAGLNTMLFTVSLNSPSAQTITVNYATAGGTATPGADFTGASGTLVYGPGDTSRQVPVAVHGDIVDESHETLTLNLSGASNAGIADGQGLGTIFDDDCTGSDSGPASALDLGAISGDTGAEVVTRAASIGCGGEADWYRIRLREDHFDLFVNRSVTGRVTLTPNGSPPAGSSGDVDLSVFRDDATHSLVASSSNGGTLVDSVGVRKDDSFSNDSRNIFIRVKGFGLAVNSYTLSVAGNVFVPAQNL